MSFAKYLLTKSVNTFSEINLKVITRVSSSVSLVIGSSISKILAFPTGEIHPVPAL
jgi:hypothetical protein